MNKKCFREYDIRGVVDEDFTPPDITRLGKVFASLVIEKYGPQIVIGRDGRLSSPALATAFQDGLISCGAVVTDIGIVPTPLLYFAAHHLKSHGAVMITGSHNPPTHNGFKMMVGAKPFCGKDIHSLYEMYSSESFKENKGGSLKKMDWSAIYLDFLLDDFKENYGTSSLKVAWDSGNGAAGEIVSRLLQTLPGTHFHINGTIDGNFPSHHPDPTDPQNMIQLSELVKKEGCDFGIGFDGDGDRIGVVNPKGRLVWGDQLLCAFAEEVLLTHPGSHILADVKSSQHLFKAIGELGGKPLVCPTGHSQLKLKMKEFDAPLAGEMSGHIMFADRAFGFDDAIYAGIRLLGIFSKKEISFEEWLDRQPQSFKTKEIHIHSDQKFQQMEQLKSLLRRDEKVFSEIDGIRFEEKTGWWLIRASNTQENIVIRVEADSKTQFKALLAQAENYLAQVNLHLNLSQIEST